MRSLIETLAAQRFVFLLLGQAWTLLGSRENSKPERCLKMHQNPQRPVHASLGVVLFFSDFVLRKTFNPIDVNIYLKIFWF